MVKRYLPRGTFALLIADAAHAYKSGDTQSCSPVLPGRMIEGGYRPSKDSSMTSAAMASVDASLREDWIAEQVDRAPMPSSPIRHW